MDYLETVSGGLEAEPLKDRCQKYGMGSARDFCHNRQESRADKIV